MKKKILSKEGYLLDKSKFDEDIIENIKKELTVKPFIPYAFGTKIKIPSFTVYQENDRFLSIPKFYGLKKLGEPDKNVELKGKKISIKFKGKLRPKQNKIVKIIKEYMKKNNGGLLSLGCGQGKTVIALYIACFFKIKTLVIVHKSFLLNQWIERANQFTNASLGIIQQKKIDIDGKDIVIGMLQSIAKDNYDPDIFRDFGLIIFDEAHHAPSKFFSKALPLISCKYSLALSATPERNDKLEKVLFWYLGDLMYKEESKKEMDVVSKIYKYNLNSDKYKLSYLPFTGKVNRPKSLTNICKLKKRNKFIKRLIEETIIQKGRKILVLSDRIDHLNILKEKLDENIWSDFYIGGRKQTDLDKAAKADVIFATFSMASEALDIPTLNTLIMVTPRSNIEQSVGRILRTKNHNIVPLILDIEDQLECFARQGKVRRRYYCKKEYKVMMVEVEDNKILSEEEYVKRKTIRTKKNTKINYNMKFF